MVPTVPILNIYLDISESGNPWPLWESCIYRDPCHFVGILRTIRLHHVADLSQTFIQPEDGTSRKPDSSIEGHPGFGFDSRPNPQVIILPTQTNGAIRSEMIRDGCFSFPKWCFSLNRGTKKPGLPRPKKILTFAASLITPKMDGIWYHLMTGPWNLPLPGTCSPPLSSMPLQLKVIQNVTRRPIRCVDGWVLGGKQRAVLVVSSVWKRDLFIYMDLEEINIHKTCFNGHKLETCENVF